MRKIKVGNWNGQDRSWRSTVEGFTNDGEMTITPDLRFTHEYLYGSREIRFRWTAVPDRISSLPRRKVPGTNISPLSAFTRCLEN